MVARPAYGTSRSFVDLPSSLRIDDCQAILSKATLNNELHEYEERKGGHAPSGDQQTEVKYSSTTGRNELRRKVVVGIGVSQV